MKKYITLLPGLGGMCATWIGVRAGWILQYFENFANFWLEISVHVSATVVLEAACKVEKSSRV